MTRPARLERATYGFEVNNLAFSTAYRFYRQSRKSSHFKNKTITLLILGSPELSGDL
jgi:hypothetical protein